MELEDERPGSPGDCEGPFEYPPLESEQGYWVGRWAEFKRLLMLSLRRDAVAYAIIGMVLLVTLIGMKLFGWR